MDLITIGFLIAFGSLFLPDKKNISTAPTIALNPMSEAASGIIDPKAPNLGGMMVGTESMLDIYLTPSKEEVRQMVEVPEWAENSTLNNNVWFFTINNSTKEYSWNLNHYYIIKTVGGKIQILGDSTNYNTVEQTWINEYQKIYTAYQTALNSTAGDGPVDAEEGEDVGSGGTDSGDAGDFVGGGISGGFGTMSQTTDSENKDEDFEEHFMYKPKSTEKMWVTSYNQHLDLDAKGWTHEPSITVVEPTGFEAMAVNEGGSPYGDFKAF